MRIIDQARHRGAALQLQMVLALTLTLVLTLELVQDSASQPYIVMVGGFLYFIDFQKKNAEKTNPRGAARKKKRTKTGPQY